MIFKLIRMIQSSTQINYLDININKNTIEMFPNNY